MKVLSPQRRPLALLVLTLATAACYGDGSEVPLAPADDVVAVDKSTVSAAAGELFEVEAWIEVPGVGAGQGERVTPTVPGGLELVESIPGDRSRFVFRATRTGDFTIEFGAVNAHSTFSTAHIEGATIRVDGANSAVLPGEVTLPTARLLDSRGCAMARALERLQISTGGDVALDYATSATDEPAQGACAAAEAAVVEFAVHYETDQTVTVLLTDAWSPSQDPAAFTVHMLSTATLDDFDGATTTWEFTPSSPNNNCSEVLPALAEGVGAARVGNRVNFTWPIGTVSFGAPAEGILFSGDQPRELQPGGTFRQVSFDSSYAPVRGTDGQIYIEGQGGGNIAHFVAETGTDRVCSSWYNHRVRLPYTF